MLHSTTRRIRHTTRTSWKPLPPLRWSNGPPPIQSINNYNPEIGQMVIRRFHVLHPCTNQLCHRGRRFLSRCPLFNLGSMSTSPHLDFPTMLSQVTCLAYARHYFPTWKVIVLVGHPCTEHPSMPAPEWRDWTALLGYFNPGSNAANPVPHYIEYIT